MRVMERVCRLFPGPLISGSQHSGSPQDYFVDIPNSVYPNGNSEFLANQGSPPHLSICLHNTSIQDSVSHVQASLVTFYKVTNMGPPEFFLSSDTDGWEIGRFCLTYLKPISTASFSPISPGSRPVSCVPFGS